MFNSRKLQKLQTLFPAFLCVVEAPVGLLYSNSRYLLDVCSLQYSSIKKTCLKLLLVNSIECLTFDGHVVCDLDH